PGLPEGAGSPTIARLSVLVVLLDPESERLSAVRGAPSWDTARRSSRHRQRLTRADDRFTAPGRASRRLDLRRASRLARVPGEPAARFPAPHPLRRAVSRRRHHRLRESAPRFLLAAEPYRRAARDSAEKLRRHAGRLRSRKSR